MTKESSNVNKYDESITESNIGQPLIESSNIGIRSTSFRWVALALACATNIGSFYSFDTPQPLQKEIQKALSIDNLGFGLLYSVYSLPNIVLPFFGGLILDRLGARIAIGVFAAVLILGQGIVTYGMYATSYPIVIAGRVIFGMGAESLSVSQSSVTAKWFMGKELAFGLGVTLCVARMGSSLNSILSPKIYNWSDHSLYVPFLVGTILCVFSWICGLTLGTIDKKADEKEGTQENGNNQEEEEGFSFKIFKNFKKIYFLLLFNCFFLYGAFFGLNNNLNDIMQRRFGFTSEQAGNFIPIVYVCSAIITPLFGRVTDAKGKRVFFMLISSTIFFIDHLAIAFLPDHPEAEEGGTPNYAMLVVLLGIGLFYATYAAIFWPCIPLVVPEKLTGTAYGIVTSLQNLMLAIIPIVLGAIQGATKEIHKGYFYTEIALAAIVGIGIFVTSWMYFEDKKTGSRLDKPGGGAKASALAARSFTKQ